jgi:hypothetical protein
MLDGLEVTLGKDDLGEWAEASVFRKDMNRPFRYRVYQSEYASDPKGTWKTHPRAMLTKTAEVFALRRAFDVALTPVEEMGFEEVGTGIPINDPSPTNEAAHAPGMSDHNSNQAAEPGYSSNEIFRLEDMPPGNETAWMNSKDNFSEATGNTGHNLSNGSQTSTAVGQANLNKSGESTQTVVANSQSAANNAGNRSQNDNQRRRLF